MDRKLFNRVVCGVTLVAFLVTGVPVAFAQAVLPMPAPGTMVHLSARNEPALMVGVQLDPKDPFRFNFLMDRGEKELPDDVKRAEYRKLVKYFLASLTIPNKDMWVNLSPYEKDRIIPDNFGQTDMGRDLLAQDYLLKQVTASLIHPDQGEGKEFWKKVYEKAAGKYGTTDIPLDTFNKVWIVPDTATIYHQYDTALIVENHLKVMMDQDYLALEKNREDGPGPAAHEQPNKETAQLAAEVIRTIVIPLLEKEVNEGENFAPLRQVYSAMLMATWFKKSLKESLLGQVYADKSKVQGVELKDPAEDARIYQKYLEAYKVGVFNFIKEDTDPLTQEVLPRKYFSGGITLYSADQVSESFNFAQLSPDQQKRAGKYFKGLEIARTTLDPIGSKKTVAMPSALNANAAMEVAGQGGQVALPIVPGLAVMPHFFGNEVSFTADAGDGMTLRIRFVRKFGNWDPRPHFDSILMVTKPMTPRVAVIADQFKQKVLAQIKTTYKDKEEIKTVMSPQYADSFIEKGLAEPELTYLIRKIFLAVDRRRLLSILAEEHFESSDSMVRALEQSADIGDVLKALGLTEAEQDVARGLDLLEKVQASINREKLNRLPHVIVAPSHGLPFSRSVPIVPIQGIPTEEALMRKLKEQHTALVTDVKFGDPGFIISFWGNARYGENPMREYYEAFQKEQKPDPELLIGAAATISTVNEAWGQTVREGGLLTMAEFMGISLKALKEFLGMRPDQTEIILLYQGDAQEAGGGYRVLFEEVLHVLEGKVRSGGIEMEIFNDLEQLLFFPGDEGSLKKIVSPYTPHWGLPEKQALQHRYRDEKGLDPNRAMPQVIDAVLADIQAGVEITVQGRLVPVFDVLMGKHLSSYSKGVFIEYLRGLKENNKFPGNGEPVFPSWSMENLKSSEGAQDPAAVNPAQRGVLQKGGIDLDAQLLNMNIKRDGAGMPLPLPQQDPAMMNILGLSPTILDITSARSLPIFTEIRDKLAAQA